MELEVENHKEFKKRIALFAFLVVTIFLLILSRTWYLQVIKGREYKELSENNYIKIQKIPAPRGRVFDRKGKILISNRLSFDISFIPEEAKDSDGWFFLTLSRLLKTHNWSQKRSPFQAVKLKKDISWKELALLETYRSDLPGIVIEVSPKRVYPYHDLACHLIGYLSEVTPKELSKTNPYKMGDWVGRYGVEKVYDSYLRGIDGGRQVEVNSIGRLCRVLGEVGPRQGMDLYLTLDLNLQRLATSLLKGKEGVIIAMDPQNGEILALQSSPSFDPNLFVNDISPRDWNGLLRHPSSPLLNRAIQVEYSPGSTYKIITAIASIEEGVITPETLIDCRGFYKLGGHPFRCWKRHGKVDLHHAIVESCDVFFYEAGKRVGINRLAQYAMMFGLGRKTGINLSREKAGLVPTTIWKEREGRGQWFLGETLISSIGQGFISVTPLQLCVLYSAIANGGFLYLPQVTKKITNKERIVEKFPPVILCRASVSPETLGLIKNALFGVVNEPRGTGRRACISDIKVCGKTGTVQLVRMKNGKERELPYKLRDHAWFVGFAPVEDPKITVVVLIEHGGKGGSAAAPIAKEIIEAYLKNDV